MPPTRSKSGALLKTWRQQGPSGFRAKAWLIFRRSLVTLVALTLVFLLGYIVIRPMLLPKTYFAFISADGVSSMALPPLEYVYEDFGGFTELQNTLAEINSGERKLFFGSLSNPSDVEKQLDVLQNSSVSGNGTLVLYVGAHGLLIDDEPQLACNNIDNALSGDACVSVEDLLTRLEAIPCARKLLLLDAARCDYAPRAGFAVDGFAEALEETVYAMVDRGDLDTVWVLSAASPGERSHVSPALQQSLFAYVATKGLLGAADRDRDLVLLLDEFCDYVRYNTPRLVETANDEELETQNPVLLGKGARGASPPNGHVLYTRRSNDQAENIGEEINVAQQRRKKKGLVAQASSFISDELSNTGLAWPVNLVTGSGSATTDSGAPVGEDEEDESAAIASESREAQTKEQLRLLEEVWSLTDQLAQEKPHPAEYAPHLWREHLDHLLWLEQLQQSGELTETAVRMLANRLTDLIPSLKGEPKPGAKNVVDRLREQRPTVRIRAQQAPTLALAEKIVAEDPDQEFPQAFVDFVRVFDGWLREERTLAELDEASVGLDSEREWRDAPERLYEFELLNLLRSTPRLTEKQVRNAVAVRRLGERAVTDLHWGQGWRRRRTDYADRWRLEAERLLVFQNSADWSGRAEDRLQEAKLEYEFALQELEQVRRAERLHDDLVARYRDYLRARRLAPPNRRPTKLFDDLLIRLSSLQENLLNPGRDSFGSVQSATDDLRAWSDRLEAELGWKTRAGAEFTVDDVARFSPLELQAALASPYLPAETRLEALERRADAEKALISPFNFEAPSDAAEYEDPGPDREQSRLETAYAMALDPGASPSDPGAPIDQRIEGIQDQIEQTYKTTSVLRDSSSRAQRLAALRRAARARAISYAGRSASGEDAYSPLLHEAAWYDLLNELRDRSRRAMQDAPPRETYNLVAMQSKLQSLTQQYANQPALTKYPIPELSFEVRGPGQSATGPTEVAVIDLAGLEDTSSISTQVQWDGDGATPVWLVAEYNQNLLEISTPGIDIYTLPEVRSAERLEEIDGPDLEYPYSPGNRKLSPSFQLDSGSSRNVQITVRRRQAAGGNTKLALKAAVPGTMMRQDLEVQMPGHEELEVTPSIWSNEDCSELNPLTKVVTVYLYPNRVQPLTFSLTNKGGRTLDLKATLLAPRTSPQGVFIPLGQLDATEARDILRRFRARTIAEGVLGSVRPGQSVPIQIDPETEGSIWSAPSTEAIEKGEDGSPLAGGLLLVLEDLSEGGKRTIRYFDLRVLRPREFVNARAEYDPGSRRLSVMLSQKEGVDLPEGSVTARLNVDASRVIGNSGVFNGELRSNGVLSLNVALNADSMDYAFVDVDGYPRAFAFEAVQANQRVSWPVTEQLFRFDIFSPESGEKFRVDPTSRFRLPVQMSVDVPLTFSFDPKQEEDVLLIGVDEGNDRDLTTDSPERLGSDRSVRVFGLRPEGGAATIALNVKVDDFQLELETGKKGEANVIGMTRSGGRITARTVHPIVLDSFGPKVSGVQTVQQGDVIEVRAYAEDAERLTNVDMVQAAFDPTGEKIEWVEGEKQTGDQWLMALPITESQRRNSTATIMINAIDEVGNEGPMEIINVPIARVAPKKEGAGQAGGPPVSDKKPVTNAVRGRLTYGRSSLSKVSVELVGADGSLDPSHVDEDSGAFVFDRVPPGEYVLKARAQAAGKPRSTTTKPFKVSDRPGSDKDLKTIKLPTN